MFVDDLSVVNDSFEEFLAYLGNVLKRCEEMNLVLNCEKYLLWWKKVIVLGHKITAKVIEVDRDKIEVIAKFPFLIFVMGIFCFLSMLVLVEVHQ